MCRGCKRFDHEVIDWNAYSHEQRLIIARRLESFLTQVVSNYLEIIDQELLLRQIEHQQLRFNAEQNPYCWVFELLRAGASQIRAPIEFGLRLRSAWRASSLAQIRDLIDRDYYALSCAYYERYIMPGLDLEEIRKQPEIK